MSDALARLFPGLVHQSPSSPNSSSSGSLNASADGAPTTPPVQGPAHTAVKPHSKPIASAVAELNVDDKTLEATPVQVNQIAKVKSQYSYYMGDLVTANDLAVCYVVRSEEIRVLHNDGSKLLLKGHTGQVFDVRFSPVAPGLLASVCRGGRIFVWDVGAKQETPSVSLRTEDAAKPELYASKIAWHQSQKVLAIALANDSVALVQVEPLRGPEQLLAAVAEEACRRILCSSAVLDVCFSQTDPEVLATAHHDGCFRLWNWQTGRALWEQQGHGGAPMHAVRFLRPAGAERELLLTCGLRCEELKLWDLGRREVSACLSLRAPASGANPFYNHVFPVEGSEDVLLLANAKRKDFLCIRIGKGKDGSHVFKAVSLFDVSQPILSGRARLKKADEISLYCVQESRVQEYLLPLDVCKEGPHSEQPSSNGEQPKQDSERSKSEAARIVQTAARAFLARSQALQARSEKEQAAKAQEAAVEKKHKAVEKKQEAVEKNEEPKVVAIASKEQPKTDGSKSKKSDGTKKATDSAATQPTAGPSKGAAAAAEKEAAAPKAEPAKKAAPVAAAADEQKVAVPKAEKKAEPTKKTAPAPAAIEEQIKSAVAASLAPLLEAMERDRAEARKRQAADVERQKKLLQVLQNALEVQIPKAVEAALEKRGRPGEAAAALTEEVRRCFAELLIPRLERGVASALGQVGGASGAGSGAGADAELRGELRGVAATLLELSRRVSESVAVSHQQALANHTAALTAILDAVSHRTLPERSDTDSPSVATPSSGPHRKKALLQMLAARDYNAALAEVLSLKDVGWVMWLLKKIGDPEKVFSADRQTTVGQPIVLSLIQQLGFGFPGEEEARVAAQLEWLQAALLVLDVESPEAAPHVHGVLSPLLAKTEAAYPKWISSPLRAQFKVVCHILHSLTR